MEKSLEYVKVGALVVIAICAIILVIQGFGGGTQSVYVEGGNIDADVSGSVSVDNTVDVNLEEVIGYRVGCHQSYQKDGRTYWAIDTF